MNSLEFANQKRRDPIARKIFNLAMNSIGAAIELAGVATDALFDHIDAGVMRRERDSQLVGEFALLPFEQQEHRLAQADKTDIDLLYVQRKPSA